MSCSKPSPPRFYLVDAVKIWVVMGIYARRRYGHILALVGG